MCLYFILGGGGELLSVMYGMLLFFVSPIWDFDGYLGSNSPVRGNLEP